MFVSRFFGSIILGVACLSSTMVVVGCGGGSAGPDGEELAPEDDPTLTGEDTTMENSAGESAGD